MDRDLVEFMTSIPEEQLLRPGVRRSLVRRALAGTVPPEIFNRRQKAATVRGAMSAIGQDLSTFEALRGRFEVARHRYANSDRLWEAIRQASSIRSDNLVGLIRVLILEQWLRNTSKAFFRSGCTLVRPGTAAGPEKGNEFSTSAHAAERRFHNRKEVKRMTYSKPELLAAEAALEAIRGAGKIGFPPEGTDQDLMSVVPAYEVDE